MRCCSSGRGGCVGTAGCTRAAVRGHGGSQPRPRRGRANEAAPVDEPGHRCGTYALDKYWLVVCCLAQHGWLSRAGVLRVPQNRAGRHAQMFSQHQLDPSMFGEGGGGADAGGSHRERRLRERRQKRSSRPVQISSSSAVRASASARPPGPAAVAAAPPAAAAAAASNPMSKRDQVSWCFDRCACVCCPPRRIG